MATTRERWKEQLLSDYPKLKVIPHVVDAMIESYLQDPKRFKKTIKKLQEEPEPEPRTPSSEPTIIYGVTKGSEYSVDGKSYPLPDDSKQAQVIGLE